MFYQALYVFFIAMSPVVEITGAIPLAILTFHFTPLQAYVLALAGNLVPPMFLIPFFGKIDTYLSLRSTLWQKYFKRFLDKTRDNHIKKFEVLKEFTLLVLLIIPTPFTGVWTASLLSYIFGVPARKAIPLIIFGQLIAGLVVLATTLGLKTLFS